MGQINWWHDEVSEKAARTVLGNHFDFAVAQGPGFCAARAAGAWHANLPESFGAYKAAERIASAA